MKHESGDERYTKIYNSLKEKLEREPTVAELLDQIGEYLTNQNENDKGGRNV